jgi:hypothetical protein
MHKGDTEKEVRVTDDDMKGIILRYTSAGFFSSYSMLFQTHRSPH